MNVENYWGVHVLGQRAYFGQIPGVWLWYERGDNQPCKGLVYCSRGALWAVWLICAFSSLGKFVKTLKDWFYYLSLIKTESKSRNTWIPSAKAMWIFLNHWIWSYVNLNNCRVFLFTTSQIDNQYKS